MTELPAVLTKNFGLGPRTFNKSTNPKTKQDKSWTQTPNDKASGETEDTSNPEQDEDVSELCITGAPLGTQIEGSNSLNLFSTHQ